MENKKIRLRDRIYGSLTVKHPLVIELIKSPSFLRLKYVSQLGIPNKYYFKKGFSRYEHSIGVFILLNKLGASFKEQLAGLLHDVSHLAFSHVLDYVFDEAEGEHFQDKRHKDEMSKSDIGKILNKYGYDPKELAEFDLFNLLERPLPNLCADRIDYSLRQMAKILAPQLFKELIVNEGRIMFKNKRAAGQYANEFLGLQVNVWGATNSFGRYIILAEAIKIALGKKIISFGDLYKREDEIIDRFLGSHDKKIEKLLKTMESKSILHLTMKKDGYDHKFRYVDPEIYNKNKIVRLSDVDENYHERVVDEIAKSKRGTIIPDVDAI